jgi:hypothetical protein
MYSYVYGVTGNLFRDFTRYHAICCVANNPGRGKDIYIMKLTNYISIYLPSTEHGNTPANQEKIDKVKHALSIIFSQYFGGTTLSEHNGAWSDDHGNVITEKITVIKSFYTDQVEPGKIDQVFSIAAAVKTIFSQESVAVEHNNELILV